MSSLLSNHDDNVVYRKRIGRFCGFFLEGGGNRWCVWKTLGAKVLMYSGHTYLYMHTNLFRKRNKTISKLGFSCISGNCPQGGPPHRSSNRDELALIEVEVPPTSRKVQFLLPRQG